MALTKAIETKECLGPAGGKKRYGLLAADTKIYRGSMVAFNTSGYLVEPSAVTTLKVVGIATATVDNTGGSNGAKGMDYKVGTFILVNGTAGDALSIAEIGDPVYAVDGAIVAKVATSRSVAGVLVGMDPLGPMVELGAPIVAGIGA
jgi:hypothetical protein